MKKSILIVFLISSFLSITHAVRATHLTGGDITYECVGQDSFLVTITLFRDCSGATAPPSTNIELNSSCGVLTTQTLVKQPTVLDVSQICPSMTGMSTCNGGSLFGLQAHYYSSIVVLSAACSSWTISNAICCRSNSIINLNNPGGLFTGLSATLNSGLFPCNSSPYFTDLGVPTIYNNQTSEFNLGAIDPDGDSLVYVLTPGYESITSVVPYAAGYSYAQPLGGSSVLLDSQTGQLSLSPTALGVFVVNVSVEEYDIATGVLKGTVRRDFQVKVITINQNTPQFVGSGMTNLGDGTISSESLIACLGDSLDFNISISDLDVSDTISLTHNVYAVLDSSAVVTISGTNPVSVNVKWNVTSTGYRAIRIKGTDEVCPIPGIVSKNFEIFISTGAYAGEDLSMCVGDTVSLHANGGSIFTWSSLSGGLIDTNSTSSSYNMTCDNCANPLVFTDTTTTYLLTTNAISTCGNVDTVTVNVSQNFSLSLPNDTLICESDSLQIDFSCSPLGLNYSYNWTPGSLFSDSSISNPKVYLPQSSLLSVEVALNGCIKSGSFQVDLQPNLPSGFSLVGDSMICQGDSLGLELIIPVQTASSATCSIQTPSNINVSSGVIGTGSFTSTQTSYPNIYSRYYWGVKHQIFYSATELLAMGMESGSEIKSMAFEVATAGVTNTMDDFTIGIGCTSNPNIGTSWNTGLISVLPSQSYSAVSGWNTHVFLNSYVWDGVSNLIIEICSNNSFYVSTGNTVSKYTPTINPSVLYYRADIATVCSSISTPTVSNDRPNTKFEFSSSVDTTAFNYSWLPNTGLLSTSGVFAQVGPLMNNTYQVVVSDTHGICTDTLSKNIYVNTTAFDAGFVYDSVVCINGGVQTLMPLTTGGLFTGSGISAAGVFDPANAGVGTWNINYFIPTPVQCSNDSTMAITVLPLPDASFQTVEVCQGATNVFLNAAVSGGVWSGAGIVDTLTGEFSAAALQLGMSAVTYTLQNPCINSETVNIRIIEPFQFTLPANAIQVCEESTVNLIPYINLSGAPNQGVHPMISFYDNNGFVDNTGMFSAQGVATGTYLVDVIVSDSMGNCGSTQTLSIEVQALEFASIISDPTFCITESNARIFVQPWLFGAGVTFSQRPLGSLGVNDTLMISAFGQNGEFTPAMSGVGSWELLINYTNVHGCVGTLTDTINVLDTPDTSVTTSTSTLHVATGNGYQYQWLDCDNNRSPISGANSAVFTPISSGNYAVEITAGNCIETSSCHPFILVGMTDIVNASSIKIFPNPVTDKLTISMLGNETVGIQVIDNTGKVVYTERTHEKEIIISAAELASGVYLVKVDGAHTHFFQKVVKK